MKYLKNKLKKNKKLYAIIFTIIIAIIIYGIIFIKKTEAPIVHSQGLISPKVETLETNVKPVEQKVTGKQYKILKRNIVSSVDKSDKDKIVLLTIDDGPSPRTKEMLDVLDKHNAKAIFFINGIHNKNNAGIIKEINERGFAVGNHTWDHLNLKKEKNSKIIEKEINKNSDLIKQETGSNPRFFRAPYGESNQAVRDLIKNDGMIMMDWSGAAMDWNKSTKEKDIFVGNVMKNIYSGSIILIHEHPWSLANLDALLTDMESKGYTFVDPKDIIE